MLSGCMVFAVAGMSTDIYELLFKSTGILIGTLVAIYVIGKLSEFYFILYIKYGWNCVIDIGMHMNCAKYIQNI